MDKVPQNELFLRAKSLAEQGKRWHFHLLLKNCAFSPDKGKFAIVLENEESGQVLFALFDEKPAPQAKSLADLMYGADFLESRLAGARNPDFERMLLLVKELDRRKRAWHHHHLHPQCIFNGHKGRHCIVLEDENGTRLALAQYDYSPTGDIARIERIFYKELG